MEENSHARCGVLPAVLLLLAIMAVMELSISRDMKQQDKRIGTLERVIAQHIASEQK